MVLFKRKPVQWLPSPPIKDENSEVWVIGETSEVFLDYESYLHRMDFLKQKRFICEITGHSGLNFFEAQKSEAAGSQEVDSSFPEALREPVLRRVQFSTVSRIDHLVDHVFDDFKQDFYPGESVTVVLDDGTRYSGLVREKSKFPELLKQDGSIERKAFSRYFVQLRTEEDEEQALVDGDHIVRDRKAFTKQMLRSFLKNTVTREAWTGAPWLVKPKIAEEYKIDTKVPPRLQYMNRAAVRKANAAAVRTGDQTGMGQFWAAKGLPELMPATQGQTALQFQEYQRALQGNSGFLQPKPDPSLGPYQYMPRHDLPHHPMPIITIPAPPPPPPIKYPIEDLDIRPSRDGSHRPALTFLLQASPWIDSADEASSIDASTVGGLLETWNTLNVYCQVFLLDSFTFDDFLEAMQFSSTDVNPELFNEIHCAVLKQLVKSDSEQNGSIQISLPDLPSDEEDDSDDSDEKSESSSPTPDPEPLKRRTRSSANKAELQPPPRSRSATADVRTHRAAEMFGETGWIELLRRRDFHNGGWQLIMVGLLHQVAGRPRLQADCETILNHLAPLDADATQETARLQYSVMDINMRIKALQIICMLTLETKAVKVFLEESAAQMTELRKTKIEHQRARKDHIAVLKGLHEDRRQLQPEPEKSPTPPPEITEDADAEMEEETRSIMDSDDEEPQSSRSLRRGTDRAAERKRKREEEEERKLKAIEAKQTKGTKEYQKVLKKIEQTKEKILKEEEEISTVEDDLREADCPRTRVLGKDRFWNRYYWFERNAMPYEGLPDASTADAGYANGRIWVQGPDELEKAGFIDVGAEEEAKYRHAFQMTPAERKRAEEGPTSLSSAREWGYYETPRDIDMLIGWLNVRGTREQKLRKELCAQREVITKYMTKRHAHLERMSKKAKEEAETHQQKQKQEQQQIQIIIPPSTSTRTSKRTKPHPASRPSLKRVPRFYQCLRWTNEMALRELGHKHLDPPVVKTRGGRTVKKPANLPKDVMALLGKDTEAAAGMVTRNRQGKKALGRQGGRYNL